MAGNGQFKEEFDGIVTTIPSVVISPTAKYKVLLDETTTTDVMYVGVAQPGTATSSASWQIYVVDESGSVDLEIAYADGDTNFDNIWDDRAALSYS